MESRPYGQPGSTMRFVIPISLMRRCSAAHRSDYYKRTVEGFLDVAKDMSEDALKVDIDRMLSQPDLSFR